MKMRRTTKTLVCGVALAAAVGSWLPGTVAAEDTDTAANTEATAAADAQPAPAGDEQAKQDADQKNSTVAAKTADELTIPEAKVEVHANRDELTIGQPADAEGVKDYVITHSYAGSKSDVENKDLPQSIASVGQKVMKDQHVTTIDEALSNIAGVAMGLDSLDYWDTSSRYAIRGFGSGFNAPFYVNGLSDRYSVMSRWTGNLDRIEALKGPASVLYGDGSPGGLINFVTKKPLPYQSITLGTDFRSWGGRSLDIDMSIPMTKDKKWLSRTIMQNADYGDFRWGDVRSKRFDGSFIVQGQPKQDLTYTFEAGYHRHTGSDPGDIGFLPATGTIYSPKGLIPYDANYTDYRQFEFIARTIQARVDYKLNDRWTIHSALGYSNRSTYRDRIMGNRTVDLSTLTQQVNWVRNMRISDTKSWDTTVNGKFKAWGLKHDLTFGYTWAYSTWNTPWATMSTKTYGPISLLEDQDYPLPPAQKSYIYQGATEQRFGTYLSDIVELSSKVKLAVGGSLTRQKENSPNPNTLGRSSRVGLTYEASPGITWFVGRSTSYEPLSPTTNQYGQIFYFKPETGNQVEGGVKVDISNKASATLSAYRINRSNMVFNLDTDNDGKTDTYEQIGQHTSKGIELDSTYVIRPGWNLLLAYSYCDARIINANRYPTGTRLPSIPVNTLKLWSTYEVQNGRWKGWGFGGGLTHVGDRALGWYSKYGYLDSYNTIDMVIYYKPPSSNCRYSLNIYNLTNKKYWAYGNSSYAKAGDPRSFTLRAEWTFR